MSKIDNELKILPLRQYEVTYFKTLDQHDHEVKDVFTADYHNVQDGRNRFYRTGNVIREYQMPLMRIVVTPVDEG